MMLGCCFHNNFIIFCSLINLYLIERSQSDSFIAEKPIRALSTAQVLIRSDNSLNDVSRRLNVISVFRSLNIQTARWLIIINFRSMHIRFIIFIAIRFIFIVRCNLFFNRISVAWILKSKFLEAVINRLNFLIIELIFHNNLSTVHFRHPFYWISSNI